MPWPTFYRAAIAAAWLFALGVCLMGAPAHARGWPVGRAEPGIRTTSPILAEAARWLGRGNMTGTVGPWCADAVSFWLRRTGHAGLPGRLAMDGLRAGPRVASPKPGDLAVIAGTSRCSWSAKATASSASAATSTPRHRRALPATRSRCLRRTALNLTLQPSEPS